ncbi:MAG: EF2563 family selenium-dependent molybdenum hydroxylase system protein [Deltaproteobacteria bacterium]|nr:EF2563 family selenium-dependent molybdenum hydroxylase system protein [Deltaproteobacteria bacterium]
MSTHLETSAIKVLIRGGGDLASGVAWRLHLSGFKVVITEIERPMAVRRAVSFCEAVYEGRTEVEGVTALRADDASQVPVIWEKGWIPLLIDPSAESRRAIKPDVLVDAILAKKNLGTLPGHASLVIALGPGFVVGKDAHYVVETKRGHTLGRLLTSGGAQPNTGVPGSVQGITTDRVLRSPADGIWETRKNIGDSLHKGEIVGMIRSVPVQSGIDGILRGLIKPGIPVSRGLKIGDVDPRMDQNACYTISEKALAVAGGVLEGICRAFHG